MVRTVSMLQTWFNITMFKRWRSIVKKLNYISNFFFLGSYNWVFNTFAPYDARIVVFDYFFYVPKVYTEKCCALLFKKKIASIKIIKKKMKWVNVIAAYLLLISSILVPLYVVCDNENKAFIFRLNIVVYIYIWVLKFIYE